MTEISKLRAAVVGTGFIGLVHVDALRRLGVEICGIVGSSPRGLGGYPGRSSACVVVPPRRVGLLLVAGPDFESQI